MSEPKQTFRDKVFGGQEQMKGFALEPVPLKYRKGTYAMTAVWWGWIFATPGPLYGALNTAGWPFWGAIGLLILGNWLLAFLNYGIGLIGSRQGLSVSFTSRYSFGNIGTYIPSIIYFLTLAGWFGVSVGILAGSLGANIGGGVWLWSLAMGIVMTLLAVAGMFLISWLANWAVPLMFALMTAGAVIAVTQNPGGWGAVTNGVVPTTGGYVLPITLSIGLILSYWIVGASLAPDISRWAKGDKVVATSSLSAFGISNPYIMALGVITAIAIGNPNLFNAMPALGIGQSWHPIWFWLSIIALLLIVWTSGDCQIYTSGLALSNITKLPVYVSTAIAGAIGTLLAVAGYAFQYINFLLVLGTFVPAVAGIIIADYFLVHKSKYPHPSAIKRWVNPVAIITYVISVSVEYYLQTYMNYAGVPVLNSLILSIVLYYVLMKVTNWLNWDKAAPEFRTYPPGYPKVPAE